MSSALTNAPIVFVITGLGSGGAEHMLLRLIASASFRDRAHIVALRSGGVLRDSFAALGVEITELGADSLAKSAFAVVRLVQLLRRLKPSVVSTWMYHADLLGGIAGRFAGVPTVWGIRNSDLDSRTTKLSTRLVTRLCALLSHWVPERIISCSTVSKKIHISKGYSADKFVVIPNGFDLDRFVISEKCRDSVRRELQIPSAALLVGMVARFDPQKNHEGFLLAASIVLERMPNACFILAGSGVTVENPELKQLVTSYNLSNAVHLLGPRNDIPRLMASFDVLVSSSSYGEAFPNVVAEAMACGVACVVTDVGDSGEIVGDTGVVVPARDVQAIARGISAILSLSNDERRVIGLRARQRVHSKFDLAEVVSRYEDTLRGVSKVGQLQ